MNDHLNMQPNVLANLYGGTSALPPGGQELIALEIVAAVVAHEAKTLYLPFPLGPALSAEAQRAGIVVWTHAASLDQGADAMYLGTPTIVDNKKLFPGSHPEYWDYERERNTVCNLCSTAGKHPRMRVIVTGLGSGDVSVRDRLDDMNCAGPGWARAKVIAWKDFGIFQDHVLLTYRKG